MFNQEMYDELYYDYNSSTRGAEDGELFGEKEIINRVYALALRYETDESGALADEIMTHVCDAMKIGFFRGMREAGRHLMLTEVHA